MKKIRIGYLSDGFSNGALRDFLPVYFTAYDKNRFEVLGYHTGACDAVTALFREAADGWRDVAGQSAEAIAAAIRKDGIDLLVQLTHEDAPLLAAVRAAHPAPLVHFEPEAIACYSPFEKVLTYSVCAPCLDCGAVKTDYLDRKSASEIDYDALDFGLYRHAPTLAEVCRAANHGVPVVICDEGGSPALARTMDQLGMGGLYTRTERDFSVAALRLSEDFAEIAHYHRRLHWNLHSSPMMTADAFILKAERVYSCLLARRGEQSKKALEKLLEGAEQQRDWHAFLFAFHALDGLDAIPKNKCLMAAWAYFFLRDDMRSLYWAQEAERRGEEKHVTQLYLQMKGSDVLRKWQHLYAMSKEIVSRAEAGEPIQKEVRFAATMYLAGISYRLGHAECTHWYKETSRMAERFSDTYNFFSGALITYNFQDISPTKIRAEHEAYNTFFSSIKRYSHVTHKRGEKLRIGYISPDFRRHVMSNFCWPFLATFDRESFEVYGYNLGADDQYTSLFHSLVTKWRDIEEKDPAKIAAQIHADSIDILVDLAGHTNGSGLPVLAWKPAPILVSGLGYMTTTGLKSVDYFLTDGFVDPPGQGDEFFTEKLVRLKSQFCYNGETNLPASGGAPAISRGWVMFGVFNKYLKITDEMLSDWAMILASVPRSRLLIKNYLFVDIPSMERAYGRFEAAGLPMDRVHLEPASSDYMRRYLDVDIALDTYPYPGGGTTCDALYMGVPVIARYDDLRHSTRFSYGILSVVGLSELASPTREGYIEAARALALDWELLDALHRNLRAMMKASPLMDAEGYMADVEAHYRRMWQAYEEGKDERV